MARVSVGGALAHPLLERGVGELQLVPGRDELGGVLHDHPGRAAGEQHDQQGAQAGDPEQQLAGTIEIGQPPGHPALGLGDQPAQDRADPVHRNLAAIGLDQRQRLVAPAGPGEVDRLGEFRQLVLDARLELHQPLVRPVLLEIEPAQGREPLPNGRQCRRVRREVAVLAGQQEAALSGLGIEQRGLDHAGDHAQVAFADDLVGMLAGARRQPPRGGDDEEQGQHAQEEQRDGAPGEG